MKPHPLELRERIIRIYAEGNTSIRKLAERFAVSKGFVQKMLNQQQEKGHVNPGQQGGHMKGFLEGREADLVAMVEEHQDATLAEYCEYWGEHHSQWVSPSTMCRALQKARLTLKKKTLRSTQAATERVQKLRVEYWDVVKDIAPENLIFLDEMGVLLGLTRTQARSLEGTRVYDLKPFYRGAKVTVIGAISLTRVIAVMTMNDSMDGKAFEVYIKECLVPQLWPEAAVVMDNLAAHKVAAITPLIEATGARVVHLSPYSPEFNPIEHWWSQLQAFLRQFSPTTTQMVDTLIATALDLVNPEHLRNWFANCCYCAS